MWVRIPPRAPEKSIDWTTGTITISRSILDLEARAIECEVELALDGYCFSDAPDGSRPWHLDRVTHVFSRAREWLELGNTVRFHDCGTSS